MVRLCGSCGNEFDDLSRTSPRTYCYECSPLPGRAGEPADAPAIPGEPFTIEHFRRWSTGLVLKGGEPFVLEQWQARFIEDVFAGFKECWLIVGEGNGKSTLIAVLILYCLEFSPEASIPVAASARDQAEIIYTQATGFERRSPSLTGRFVCKPGLREIVFAKVSRAKIFASDAGTGDGIIPTPIEVLDELHRHQTLELYRTWAGKLVKESAQLIVISTAGEPGSEFEEQREAMRQGADGVDRDGCFGRFVGEMSVMHEYAVPEDGDVEDLVLVKGANPSSRITVETLRQKRAMPSWAMAHWRRLTCNMPTRFDSVAITERMWAAALAPSEKRAIPDGKMIWAGLDLGWVYDTTAIVPLWMESLAFRLFGPATILTPPADGSQLPQDHVERAFREIHERTPIHTVVMDMTKGQGVAQWLEDDLGVRVIDRGQTNAFAAMDYERFMEGLRDGTLFHCGDPEFRKHAMNAIARMLPLGDMRFDRPRSSRTVTPILQKRRVIDALVAAAMVHSTAFGEMAEPYTEPMIGFG